MVRGGPLLCSLHNWWCDIRHNCHKNHRGREASLSSQRGGKIVFKDFYPDKGPRSQSQFLIINISCEEEFLWLRKYFILSEELLLKETSTLQKSLESSSEEEPDTITLLFRFPVCSSSPTYRLFFSFQPTHIKPWLASCSRYGVTNFTLFVILPAILGRWYGINLVFLGRRGMSMSSSSGKMSKILRRWAWSFDSLK